MEIPIVLNLSKEPEIAALILCKPQCGWTTSFVAGSFLEVKLNANQDSRWSLNVR